MSGVNVNVSVTNLPQIDRHQNDMHKNPVVYQEQNAKIASEENLQKLSRPVETEQTQGKTVDADQRKEDSRKRNKKQKRVTDNNMPQNDSSDEGFIVDIKA
jgi:hypothetical protein